MPSSQKTINQRLNKLLETTQNKTYATLAVTVIFVIVMVLFGILPAYNAFVFQNEENNKRDLLISNLQTKLNTNKSLEIEYKNNKDSINYFNKILPTDSSQENIVSSVNQYINNNNLFLKSLTFVNQSSNELPPIIKGNISIKGQSLNIILDGKRENILKFIQAIELSTRIFNIQSSTISKSSIVDAQGNSITGHEFALSLQLDYYYFNTSV